MARERHRLGTPFTADGPWLAALLDALNDVYDLLDARLPRPGEAGRPVKVEEPGPSEAPPVVVPVSEPAPHTPPSSPKPAEEPDKTDDPEEDAPAVSPEPPPRAGRGSSLKAWQAFADSLGVDYPADGTRDDVIAAFDEWAARPS